MRLWTGLKAQEEKPGQRNSSLLLSWTLSHMLQTGLPSLSRAGTDYITHLLALNEGTENEQEVQMCDEYFSLRGALMSWYEANTSPLSDPHLYLQIRMNKSSVQCKHTGIHTDIEGSKFKVWSRLSAVGELCFQSAPSRGRGLRLTHFSAFTFVSYVPAFLYAPT